MKDPEGWLKKKLKFSSKTVDESSEIHMLFLPVTQKRSGWQSEPRVRPRVAKPETAESRPDL
jgi:hypothetical protein